MKKVGYVLTLCMVVLSIAICIFGVYASQTVSYNITGKITYTVENNIELTSTALSLSATASCTHVAATSGTGVTGSNISNYFKVTYNGSEQTQSQIVSLISDGTLVVSATSNVTVSSGLVKMSNVSSSASTSQSLSLSLKFSDSSAVTKTGTGTISRTNAGTETKNAYSATCTSTGYTGDTCCKSCGKVLSSGSSIDKTSHDYSRTGYTSGYYYGSWSSWTTTTEATCTTSGTQTRSRSRWDYPIYTCSNCGDSYTGTTAHYYSDETATQTIDALGHNYSVSGYTSGYNYGSWSSWTTTKAATCTTSGTKTRSRDRWDYPIYTCSRCSDSYEGTTKHYYSDDTETDTISALGHDYSTLVSSATSATCTSSGATAKYKCSRCSSTSGGTTITALGHNWSTYDSSYSAQTSSDEDGIYYYHIVAVRRKCSRCSTDESYASRNDSCSFSKSSSTTNYNTNGHWTSSKYKCSKCSNSYTDSGTVITHTMKYSSKLGKYQCTGCSYTQTTIITNSVQQDCVNVACAGFDVGCLKGQLETSNDLVCDIRTIVYVPDCNTRKKEFVYFSC